MIDNNLKIHKKNQYQKPHLIVLGNLKTLTLGGTNIGTSDSGDPGSKYPPGFGYYIPGQDKTI